MARCGLDINVPDIHRATKIGDEFGEGREDLIGAGRKPVRKNYVGILGRPDQSSPASGWSVPLS